MCGIIGVYSKDNNNLINNCITLLKGVQNRGQDSCGITFYNDRQLDIRKTIGTVDNLIKILPSAIYTSVMGHVRYITSGGENSLNHTQPLKSSHDTHCFSVVFNGNLNTIDKWYPDITLDTFGIIKYLSTVRDNMSFQDNIISFINNIPGVYCISILYEGEIYLVRDRFGIRPLFISCDNNAYHFSSESSVFNNKIEVQCGQVIKLGKKGIEYIYNFQKVQESKCLFEFVYFMNDRSSFGKISTDDFRNDCGKQLSINDNGVNNENNKYSKNNTIVVGCPNSGICSALAYSKHSDLEYVQVIKKNKKAPRTFILNNNNTRIAALQKKFSYSEDIIKDKVIIIVDDSIVRGNTFKILLEQLRSFKPSGIHIRIASPPVLSQCFYGIDIPTKEELIYNTFDSEYKLNKYYNTTSFKYLKVDFFNKKLNNTICTSCFTGEYNEELNW